MKWLVLVGVAACAGAAHTIKDSKKQVFPDYDQSIQRDMRTWHYRPVSIGGVAMRVCTAVRIRQDLQSMPWYRMMLRRRQF